MKKNLLAFILFFASFSIFGFQFYQMHIYKNQTLPKRLQMLWAQDINYLRGRFGWKDFQSIKYLKSEERPLLKSMRLPFILNKKSAVSLELLITSFLVPKGKNFIIQHYFLDSKTKNLIFELDRTYRIEIKKK